MKAIRKLAKEVVAIQSQSEYSIAFEERGIPHLQGHVHLSRRRRGLLVLIFLTVFSCIVSQPALACTCRGAVEPPCTAYQKADAIFVGSVIDIAEAPIRSGDAFRELFVQFSIEQHFKGVPGNELTVATITGTDCDFAFEVGERYFVYAYQDSVHKRLTTGVCTRTKQVTSAQEDLAYVRDVGTSMQKSSILGRDGNNVRSQLEGVDIAIEGQGEEYRAVADSKGAFKVDVALPGKYRIILFGAVGSEFLTNYSNWRLFSANGRPAVEFEVSVTQGQCSFVDFSLFVSVKRK
jgi:hypothetical protein